MAKLASILCNTLFAGYYNEINLVCKSRIFSPYPYFFSFSIAEKSDLIYNKLVAKLLGDANFTKQEANFTYLLLK